MNNTYWILIAILKIIITVGAIMIQKYIKFTGNWYPIITSIVATILFIIYGLTFENINELKNNNLLILRNWIGFIFIIIGTIFIIDK